jgi:cystathionine beta-lyase/cystathionine gamma-synthase
VARIGVSDELVRMSVGIEATEDLIGDLSEACVMGERPVALVTGA